MIKRRKCVKKSDDGSMLEKFPMEDCSTIMKKRKKEELKKELEKGNKLKRENELKKRKNTNKIKKKNVKQLKDSTDWTYVYILLKYFFENNNLSVLKEEFYTQDDVLLLTEYLIGHILWVYDDKEKKLYASRMVELEAYNGISDKGSHAYNSNKTLRNASMFMKGGICYVYICYGIHNCLNIVTNTENKPDAILIRSTEPIYNVPFFLINKMEKYLEKKEVEEKEKEEEEEGEEKKKKNDYEKHISKYKEKFGNGHLDTDTYSCVKEIEILNRLLKQVNKKKIIKLCSGPGCVTKCLKITRSDDMEKLYIDAGTNTKICQTLKYSKGSKKKENNKTTDISNNNEKDFNTQGRYLEKTLEETFSFFSILNDCKKKRFFISICPKADEILDFFENKIEKEKEKEKQTQSFINIIYSNYKNNLIEYLNMMKWYDEQITIQKDKRIGINYAQEAALFEYRFMLKNHPSVTFPPKAT